MALDRHVTVRVSKKQRELLQRAAAQSRTSLSGYIRRKAVEAAELIFMERRIVTIPAENWEEFEAWVRSPPQDLPRLRALMKRRPVWEE